MQLGTVGKPDAQKTTKKEKWQDTALIRKNEKVLIWIGHVHAVDR